jgi:hypothetical protein
MTKNVKYKCDEGEYLRAARGFVRAMVAELNETLIENRISKSKRREICTAFVYSLCNTFDQGWVRNEGKTYYPLLAFTKKFYDIGDTLDSVAPIQMPDHSVPFYEVLGDEADWLFDDCGGKSPTDILGNVGSELPDTDLQPESETQIVRLPCSVCQGSGKCFCLRKGSGNAATCPRCTGTGKCSHCKGIRT